MGFHLFLISDCIYHRKVLYYLNKHKLFSIGLVTAVSDPWLVSFAMPVLSTNLLTQSFFLKFITLTQKKAAHRHFELKKKIWADRLHKNLKRVV
jgi:hypothetical protein